MSASSRTPIRHQMHTSMQQQTPLPVGLVDQRVTFSSRPLRTRRNLELIEEVEIPVSRRWSEENPDWAKDWQMPLILERTTVDKDDIPRLDEGECLNDNLIGYGLQYLFNNFGLRHPALGKRVYLHNSFFYEKLKAGRDTINYDGVKSWTAKVDLFSYDYIVVPVNEHYHWWVAIICNPARLDPDWKGFSGGTEQSPSNPVEDGNVEMADVTEIRPPQSPRTSTADGSVLVTSDIVDLVSDDKDARINRTPGSRSRRTRMPKSGARTNDPEGPRIITLDSMGSTHPQAINLLKKYLVAEFEHKRKKVLAEPNQPVGMKARNIPEQNNLCDCGVYLLGYIQEFVQNPDEFISTLLRKETWDWNFNPSNLRQLWRDTIKVEQSIYQKGQLQTRGKKRESSATKITPKGSAQPSRCPSRDVTNSKGAPDRESSEQLASKSAVAALAHSDNCEGDLSLTPPAASANGPKKIPSAAPMTPGEPQHNSLQQTSPNGEQAVSLFTQEDNHVLASIEDPDLEELPGPHPQAGDEPVFISQLPSSSIRGSGDDRDAVAEVDPGSFYASKRTPVGNGRKRNAPFSPGKKQRKRMVNDWPMHTASHFILDGNVELDPVVEKAEVVRRSDPIDLT